VIIKKLCFVLFCLFPFFLFSSDIDLKLEQNLLVRIPVPEKGIVCSNMLRAKRLSKLLDGLEVYESSWGPTVYSGSYKGEKIFIASASIGSGSGLMFTELFSAGAENIIRFGSDDAPSPAKEEFQMVKIIDEADNLIGYDYASGLSLKDSGKSIFASQELVSVLENEAQKRGLTVEKRVCHHLENYHALRNPKTFPKREGNLNKQREDLRRPEKRESFDMETAVLFRVAKDFGKKAASVLQTVDKESFTVGPYEGRNKEKALVEEGKFADFVLTALIGLPLEKRNKKV
jgi:uridine phosphorylase